MLLEKKKKISVFRLGVIHSLLSLHQEEGVKLSRQIQELSEKRWNIPYSESTSISSSTIRNWLKRYVESGEDLTALEPYERSDKGNTRSIDHEIEMTLVNLKKQNPDYSLPVLLMKARKKGLIPKGLTFSSATLYRIIKKHGINENTEFSKKLKRYEVEFPNELWQADAMHGPRVMCEGKERKVFLFAIIDDHSRLIPHAEFYSNETLNNFKDCLKKAICKRGLPRKLYTDNGSLFRSHQLEYITASLGTVLLHTEPYRPEGKGKIERWFRTVRECFLPLITYPTTLEELNLQLSYWIEKHYHKSRHSSTGENPLERYCRHLEMIRNPEKELEYYFREMEKRKVKKDKTVNFMGTLYEAPFELVNRTVEILFNNPVDVKRLEIFFQGKSYGYLIPLDQYINSRLKNRKKSETEWISKTVTGNLFGRAKV